MIHKKSNNLQALKNISEFSSYMLLINLKDDNETLLSVVALLTLFSLNSVYFSLGAFVI